MTAFWSPRPLLVAGPCVADRDAVNLAIAARLTDLSSKFGLRVIFKASFDKANRSVPHAPRGPGIDRGLAALRRVRDETGLPVLTDVHEVWQVEQAAAVVDALQIPAFLCRQTDLLEAVGRVGKPVNIKKGQWMTPEAMAGAVAKVQGAGGEHVAVTERGTFFGYGDLVVDMRSFRRMRTTIGTPVLFDATHAVQQPGRGAAGTSGGSREETPHLLSAAAAAGADGFFLETHPRPAESGSDAASIWPLDDLEALIDRAVTVWHAAHAEGAATWTR